MIIGICGFIGSGKDSIADYLVSTHEFARLSFATVLKDACASIFQWDREMLEGKTEAARKQRESVDTWWADNLGIENFSPRYALQYVGTELFRDNLHRDIWALAVERRLSQYKNVVISDVRFPNEIKMLQRNFARIWCVQRGVLPHWFDNVKGILQNEDPIKAKIMIKSMYPDVHESEWAWTGTEFNQIIDNNGTLIDLFKKVERIHFDLAMQEITLKNMDLKVTDSPQREFIGI